MEMLAKQAEQEALAKQMNRVRKPRMNPPRIKDKILDDLESSVPKRRSKRGAPDTFDDRIAAALPGLLPKVGPVDPAMVLTSRERRDLILVLAEKARRAKSALRLYHPTPEQDAFHADWTKFRIVRGSNRAGKTLCTAVELARAVENCDPYEKWPKSGRLVIVGRDLRHCAKVIYRKMFKPGAFKIIRDLETGDWRTYDPVKDLDRKRESEDAPPLIPYSSYSPADIAWEDKREEVPSTIYLRKTGWELMFFSALASPPQGIDVDGVLFDEEIPNSLWLKEMKPRLVDRGGRFLWSATPQVGCGELIDLSEQASKEKGLPNPRVAEHFMTIDLNPWIGEQEKADFKADFASDEDEYSVRVEGQFATSGLRVYPEFGTRGPHRVNSFPIGDDWMRSLAIDPGRQVAACLFIATPPGHLPDHVQPVVYDEIYLKKANAQLFAKEMRRKLGNTWVRNWVIDSHEGNKHETGSGLTIEEQYATAFRGENLDANGFGGFRWANSDVAAGILAAKTKLHIENGVPAWLFMVEKLPNFCYEISRYVNKRISKTGIVVDENSRSNVHNHLMDCFDEKTEVLTDRGWLLFSDVSLDDFLATVNLESDLIEYQQPSDLIRKHHDGLMIRFSGHKLDALVTPNHRMVVYPGQSRTNPVEVKLAKDLDVWDRIKLNAKWNGYHGIMERAPYDIDPKVFCEFLGWYAAEGSRYENWNEKRGSTAYQVFISQTKESGKSRIREILDQTPWNWGYSSNSFQASSKELFKLMGDLGCGDGHSSKRVPDHIRHLSPELIDCFLNGCTQGDGWTQAGRRTISTTSRELADGLQELFIKIGKSASVRKVQRSSWKIKGRSGKCKLQYWVSEWNTDTGLLRDSENRPNFHEEHYKGEVFCASVPNGTLIVRRNGKPMIAGNCFRYLALMNLKFQPNPRQATTHQSWTTKRILEKKKAKAKANGWGDSIRLG